MKRKNDVKTLSTVKKKTDVERGLKLCTKEKGVVILKNSYAFVVTRYWDNDEPDEYFRDQEFPVAVFYSFDSAIAFINKLTSSDILLDEAEFLDIGNVTCSTDETMAFIINNVIFYKAFYCKEKSECSKKRATETKLTDDKLRFNQWEEWGIQKSRNIIYYVYKLKVTE